MADSGAVEDHVRVFAGRKRLLLNRSGGVNQAAQHRLFFHDARVVLHVGDARQTLGKLRDISDAAGGFELAAAAEIFHQRDGIDGLLLFTELHHVLEDVAVLRKEKVLGAESLDGGVQRVIIEQHGAEDAALGFQIVRQRAFEW